MMDTKPVYLAAFTHLIYPPHLCARRGMLQMSIWKSSWESFEEFRAGERSTSRAKDSILWRMDTILQGTKGHT